MALFLFTVFADAKVVDTSTLFWNSFLYVDYSYGTSYLTLSKINRDYIDAFAKPWLFKSNLHWSEVFLPTIGIPFGNSIVSLGFYCLHMKDKGEAITIGSETYQNYFFLDYYSCEIEYRRCFRVNKFLLLNPGLCGFYGKGYLFVGTQSFYESNKSVDELITAEGGGAGVFFESLLQYKSMVIGPRIGINVGLTNALKTRSAGEWIPSVYNMKINLDLSGFYILLKIGFLI